MGSGYYAAGSALMARVHELDLIAENLANVSTPGYRAEQETFKAVLADSNSSTNLDRAINNYGVLGGGSLDLSQGAFEKTGNQLDLALRGPGFFVVQTPRGDVYTRDGNFQISAKHQLNDAHLLRLCLPRQRYAHRAVAAHRNVCSGGRDIDGRLHLISVRRY